MDIKIRKKYIIVIILILLSVVFTTSLAYFGVTIIGDSTGLSGVQTGNIELDIDDDIINISSFAPIYDKYHETQAYIKEFTLTNSSAVLNECVSVFLDISSISEGLKNVNMKWKLESLDGTILEMGNFSDANIDEDFSLYEGFFLEKSAAKEFRLYIWLSYNRNDNQISSLGTNLVAKVIGLGIDSKNSGECYNSTPFSRNDLDLISLYINNELANDLDPNTYYSLSSYACINGETVTYNEGAKAITVQPLNQATKCSLYFETIDSVVFDFDYHNYGQEFIVPVTGVYQIELWGARGGQTLYNDSVYGYGGYTSGYLLMNKDEKYYIYTGENGYPGAYGSTSGGLGGVATFNGGGAGGIAAGGTTYPYSNYFGGSSGGGATDIRYFGATDPTASQKVWSSSLGLNSRIMVAGGSGGATVGGPTGTEYIGSGGGLNGQNGAYISGYANRAGTGGKQNSGYSFGTGGIGNNSGSSTYCHGHSGGAGGYYGGSGGLETGGLCYVMGGGGGSSFVSGHYGCFAIANASLTNNPRTLRNDSNNTLCTTSSTDRLCSVHYSGKEFSEIVIIDGSGHEWQTGIGNLKAMPNPDGGFYTSGTGHSGNGRARITYIGNN